MLNRFLDAPWKGINQIKRLLSRPLVHAGLAIRGVEWGPDCLFFGMPRIQKVRGSVIKLGRHNDLRSWPSSNPLSPLHPVVLATRNPEAKIITGNDCGFTGTTPCRRRKD